MGEEIAFKNLPNLLLSRARDLDLGSGHTAHRHASFIDLYLHTKLQQRNRRNVLWADGLTDVWTYRWTFETHFIRSTRRSRPKNNAATYNKIHLSAISMRQQEKTQDRRERDLVVKSLAMELQKRRVHFDVVTASISNKQRIIFHRVHNYPTSTYQTSLIVS